MDTVAVSGLVSMCLLLIGMLWQTQRRTDGKTDGKLDGITATLNQAALTSITQFAKVEGTIESLRSDTARRFDGIDARLDTMDIRLDRIETRLIAVESR